MSARAAATTAMWIVAALVVAAGVGLAVEPASAQAGPFGVGSPEQGLGSPSGGGVFAWVAAKQNEFYRAMTAGLKAMRGNPSAGWWMVALSFGYGVFHAAGPGHGKAVITSYVLAADETLKRGIVLAFVSALVQGLVAIVFVAAAIRLFHLTAVQMTDATTALERTSAAAILTLGLWLAWTKIVSPALASWRERRRAAAVTASEADVVDCAIGGDPVAAAAACACGVAHMPPPELVKGPLDWKRALSAIGAVGIRPCTGALIVLVFAFAQSMPIAGVASVLAMALGTGLTVSALAAFAVSMRGLALRIAGDEGPWARRVLRGAEAFGALLVLGLGVLLAGAAIVGAPAGG